MALRTEDIAPVRLEVENLRGFSYANFPLENERIVLVGPNNSGKTSALLLIDWIFNIVLDAETAHLDSTKEHDTEQLLQPARDTRNKARRLSLYVRIGDARRYSRFKCNRDGIAQLRFNVHSRDPIGIAIKIGPPKRGEGHSYDKNAVELLRELRKQWRFEHIPSFRDIKSKRFQDTLYRSYLDALNRSVVDPKQGQPTTEKKRFTDACKTIDKIAKDLISPSLERMKEVIPHGMHESNILETGVTPEKIASWIADSVLIKMSTGHHDKDGVHASELGSGLQSLLDLAVNSNLTDHEDHKLMLAIEEPEAFLHPSAQRTLAKKLLTSKLADKILFTTHSTILIQEAEYNDITLVSDFRFFPSRSDLDQSRQRINSSLISGIGAEALFAKAILFVEGEGDRLYFEAIRRRMAKIDPSGQCEHLHVIPTGSCTHFAPWIRMVNSFTYQPHVPIRWLAIGRL